MTSKRTPTRQSSIPSYWADLLAVIRHNDPELFETLRRAVLAGPPSEEATALEMTRYQTLETAIEAATTRRIKP